MKLRHCIPAAFALIAGGCGRGGEDSTDETAAAKEAAAFSDTVATCMEGGGMTGVEVADTGKGEVYAVTVGGKGPSGAALGAVITRDPKVAQAMAQSFSKKYRVRISSDGLDLLIYGDDTTARDRGIAEACMAE